MQSTHWHLDPTDSAFEPAPGRVHDPTGALADLPGNRPARTTSKSCVRSLELVAAAMHYLRPGLVPNAGGCRLIVLLLMFGAEPPPGDPPDAAPPPDAPDGRGALPPLLRPPPEGAPPVPPPPKRSIAELLLPPDAGLHGFARVPQGGSPRVA